MAKNRNKKNKSKATVSMEISTDATATNLPQGNDPIHPVDFSFVSGRIAPISCVVGIGFDPRVRVLEFAMDTSEAGGSNPALGVVNRSVLTPWRLPSEFLTVVLVSLALLMRLANPRWTALARSNVGVVWSCASIVEINRKTKKGVPRRRSKNLRKQKAMEKAIALGEKTEDKISKNKSKISRIQSAKSFKSNAEPNAQTRPYCPCEFNVRHEFSIAVFAPLRIREGYIDNGWFGETAKGKFAKYDTQDHLQDRKSCVVIVV
ncbi:hypothetical protein ACLOJK_015192 [Asimina triloba]